MAINILVETGYIIVIKDDEIEPFQQKKELFHHEFDQRSPGYSLREIEEVLF
jgi:hypothetical protein